MRPTADVVGDGSVPHGPLTGENVWPPSVERYTPFGTLPGESFSTPTR